MPSTPLAERGPFKNAFNTNPIDADADADADAVAAVVVVVVIGDAMLLGHEQRDVYRVSIR
jgi:hypothetical protein